MVFRKIPLNSKVILVGGKEILNLSPTLRKSPKAVFVL